MKSHIDESSIAYICDQYGWDYFDRLLTVWVINATNEELDFVINKLDEVIKYHVEDVDKKSPEYKKRLGKVLFWQFECYTEYDRGNCYREWNKDYFVSYSKQMAKDVVKYLKGAVKAKNPDAYARCAYYYYIGEFIAKKPNYKKAQEYFKKAQENDSLFVEFLVGEALIYKSNNLEDYKKAIPYYKKAIEKKVFHAKTGLAKCYLKLGINLEEAKELFLKDKMPNYKDYVKEVEKAMKKKASR